jgi:hydrogenase maturation protein HypF
MCPVIREGRSLLPPDLATCASCREEMNAEDGRRHRYPFTSCAACGPRYSICTGLPYDRRHTSMRTFVMCGDCAREYDDARDRRHHAQPIACPSCGPELAFLGTDGRILASGANAIAAALRVLASSGIIGVRGLGGFQLFCDATDATAVGLLRARKHRPDKPFAVMFRDRDQLGKSADVSDDEWRVLLSPEAPIVLVTRRDGAQLAENVAPRSVSSLLGAMLPCTPLHALILDGARSPLVCTSGNQSAEPPCTSSEQAVSTLASIADGFLDNDLPIVRALEDSLVRPTARHNVVLRRARGYVPLSIGSIDSRATVLALGAQLKSTVTLGYGGSLLPSQHLGDLDSSSTRELLELTARDLCALFEAAPALLACDRNLGYASSVLAERLSADWGLPLVHIQHHHAHVAAAMAEHGLGIEQGVLGLIWDGPGTGDDGTLWGGEALACRNTKVERIATLSAFPLLGGDRAAVDPRRAALGLLFELVPSELSACTRSWSGSELDSCIRVLERRLAPMCSSVSRLFDAVAALIGICERTTFEGQAALELEHLASSVAADGAYPLPIVRDRRIGLLAGDTRTLVLAILDDMRKGVDQARIARRFHEALIGFGVALAEQAGIADVIPNGDCFQNRLLVDGLETRLERAGFKVHMPEAIPANDGGVSVGQAWLAAQHAMARV